MIEPNADLPWDIYLDWLQDQGNEDLRGIEPNILVIGYMPSISLELNNGDGFIGSISYGDGFITYDGGGYDCEGSGSESGKHFIGFLQKNISGCGKGTGDG